MILFCWLKNASSFPILHKWNWSKTIGAGWKGQSFLIDWHKSWNGRVKWAWIRYCNRLVCILATIPWRVHVRGSDSYEIVRKISDNQCIVPIAANNISLLLLPPFLFFHLILLSDSLDINQFFQPCTDNPLIVSTQKSAEDGRRREPCFATCTC